MRREVWSQCLGWEVDDASDIVLGGKDSRVVSALSAVI